MKELFSIGYSKFNIDDFIETLKINSIDAIADVRSEPYSRFKPEFNRNNLKHRLSSVHIHYVFLGPYCGARPSSESYYVNGKADYNLIKNSDKFRKGLERIRNGLQKHRIALLCAENDPIFCHRNILICRNLRSPELMIKHIINADRIESNEETENRLLRLFHLDENELFTDRESLIEEAYDKQSNRIAYDFAEDKSGNRYD